jgi:hypothetical protein
LKKISQVTGREYDPADTVAIYNQKQYAKYVANGAEIIDCDTINDSFFVVFDKEATKNLFDAWCRHEL